MAGVSTKEIKTRIRSMESTKQITKAMEMVAASKLRKAQVQVQNSRPYFEILYTTIQEILKANRETESAYLEKRAVKKSLFVLKSFTAFLMQVSNRYLQMQIQTVQQLLQKWLITSKRII